MRDGVHCEPYTMLQRISHTIIIASLFTINNAINFVRIIDNLCRKQQVNKTCKKFLSNKGKGKKNSTLSLLLKRSLVTKYSIVVVVVVRRHGSK